MQAREQRPTPEGTRHPSSTMLWSCYRGNGKGHRSRKRPIRLGGLDGRRFVGALFGGYRLIRLHYLLCSDRISYTNDYIEGDCRMQGNSRTSTQTQYLDMIAQFWFCKRQHSRREEHCFIIRMCNKQTYALVVQGGKRVEPRRS